MNKQHLKTIKTKVIQQQRLVSDYEIGILTAKQFAQEMEKAESVIRHRIQVLGLER